METITLNHKTYNIITVNGNVLSSNKNLETRVSGGGGGGYSRHGTGYSAPIAITSSTTVHDQIFLLDKQGQEHAFQLSDFNLACREGNTLTVIKAVNVKKNKGPYVAVVNHSIDKIFFDPIALKMICTPDSKAWAGIYIAATLVGFAVFGGSWILFAAIALIGMIIYYMVLKKKNIQLVKDLVTDNNFHR